MRLAILLSLLLAGCTQFAVVRTMPPAAAELRVYLPGQLVGARANRCSGHEGEVAVVFRALDKVLDAHRAKTPAGWGKTPLSVCVVEARPYVMCGGIPLAGCSYGGETYVSTLWADPRTDAQVMPGYDWRKTLLYELLGTLGMRGGFVGVAPGGGAAWEAAWMTNPKVKAVLVDAEKALW